MLAQNEKARLGYSEQLDQILSERLMYSHNFTLCNACAVNLIPYLFHLIPICCQNGNRATKRFDTND